MTTAPMRFPDLRGSMKQIVVGKVDPVNHGQKWPKIKVYASGKALEVKR